MKVGTLDASRLYANFNRQDENAQRKIIVQQHLYLDRCGGLQGAYWKRNAELGKIEIVRKYKYKCG